MFILLGAAQADVVRGPSTPSAALNPTERQGGVFILGVEVLTDPAHAAHRDYLAVLPQMDSANPAFPPPVDV
tara:strand:- start:499 stop:714 length:216 start_codon:yes stop_codon:yes gene_type:complete